MRSPDTSPAALEAQRQVFRRMAPAERLRLALEMSDEIRALTEAGIRGRHPEYSEREVREALAEILLGRDLARRARGRALPAAR